MEQSGKVYPWWTSSHETKKTTFAEAKLILLACRLVFFPMFFLPKSGRFWNFGLKRTICKNLLRKTNVKSNRPWPPFFDWFRSFNMFQVVYHYPKGHQKEPPIFDQIWWQRLITYLYTWNPFWWPDTVKHLSVSFVGHVGIVEMVGGESWGRWVPICCLHILGRS